MERLEERGWGDERDYKVDGIPASLLYFNTLPGPMKENDWGIGGYVAK